MLATEIRHRPPYAPGTVNEELVADKRVKRTLRDSQKRRVAWRRKGEPEVVFLRQRNVETAQLRLWRCGRARMGSVFFCSKYVCPFFGPRAKYTLFHEK